MRYLAIIETRCNDLFDTPFDVQRVIFDARSADEAAKTAEGMRRCFDHKRGHRAILASVAPAGDNLLRELGLRP